MNDFQLFAEPWWVNLLILIPFGIYFLFRKQKLDLSYKLLFITGLFGIAFGFVEAAVVIYLRAAVGLLPGYYGSLSDIANFSSDIYQQSQILSELPKTLSFIEMAREAATMIMLITIAFIGATKARERLALFLWAFAFWDIFYYIGLYTTVKWPPSLLSPDVLFLLPVPWYTQVWYPILISFLTLITIAITVRPKRSP